MHFEARCAGIGGFSEEKCPIFPDSVALGRALERT